MRVGGQRLASPEAKPCPPGSRFHTPRHKMQLWWKLHHFPAPILPPRGAEALERTSFFHVSSLLTAQRKTNANDVKKCETGHYGRQAGPQHARINLDVDGLENGLGARRFEHRPPRISFAAARAERPSLRRSVSCVVLTASQLHSVLMTFPLCSERSERLCLRGWTRNRL